MKAREIDACKHQLQSFKSWFVPPRKYTFCPAKIDALKLKAADFLKIKFKELLHNPGKACQLPRTRGQRRNVVKWTLPVLFGEKHVTNKVLPLGYSFKDSAPNPVR